MSASPPAGSLPIDFAGQRLVLLAQRAVWWPSESSVVIADLHLGKAAAFRQHGIPVPAGNTTRDLARLAEVLAMTAANRLIILGDFLHAKAGRQPEVFAEMSRFRERHAGLVITLIRGNHDRSAGRALAEWNIDEVEEPHEIAGLALVHDPATAADRPALAGHLHPVTPIEDYDGSFISLPSFVADADRLILPAFGLFTGGFKLHPQTGRRIYIPMAGRVVSYRG